MKPQMKLLITDAPAEDVQLARSKEQHVRHDLILQWEREGHLNFMIDNDPGVIRVQIGDEVFPCARDKFPTTTLVARLQLAIASGQSNRNKSPRVLDDYDPLAAGTRAHQGMAHQAEAGRYHMFNSDWGREVKRVYRQQAQLIEDGFTAAVTAPAKKAARGLFAPAKNLRKGLRP